MLITRIDEAGKTTIVIDGEINHLTYRDATKVFDNLVAERAANTVVDMTKVTGLDSSGAGTLTNFYKRVTGCVSSTPGYGGKVTFEGAQGQPLALLKLLRLSRLFGIDTDGPPTDNLFKEEAR